MRRAIWEQQTVYAELAIVNRIAKITAIAPIVAPSLSHLEMPDRPIPNKATLQTRKLTKRLPVFIKRAQAVAHRMSIFTQDEGRFSCGKLIQFFSAYFGTAGCG